MRIRAALIGLALLTLPVAAAPPPQPARHAILVAVEEYANLPGVSLFDGPRNSLILWHDYLRRQGFNDITILSEGMDAGDVKWSAADPHNTVPTRANIQRAFSALEARLARTAGKDDVLIVLIGHGSQQRAAPNDPPKPGNLDEVYLPADAGPRNGGDPEGVFANALVDHDIAPHLKTIAAHAAFTWLIFDSCHSNTMTYDLLLLHRNNTPPRAINRLDFGSHAANVAVLPPPPTPPPAFGPSPRDADWPKNYVAFFAAGADQTTPLIVRDAGPITARIGGGDSRFTAFSYFIIDALNRNPNARFDAVLASVRANYRTVYPNESYDPKFEGGARLQLPVSTVTGARH